MFVKINNEGLTVINKIMESMYSFLNCFKNINQSLIAYIFNKNVIEFNTKLIYNFLKIHAIFFQVSL